MPPFDHQQLADSGLDIALPAGDHCLIRLLHSDDEPALREMFAACSREDVYLRCFAAIKSFPEQMAARLARMDPGAEVGLLAASLPGDGPERLLGVAHLILEKPGSHTAEFDVMVRTDEKGHGIGYALMSALLDEARDRRFEAVVGFILQENHAMLKMVGELGFVVEGIDAGVVRVRVPITLVA